MGTLKKKVGTNVTVKGDEKKSKILVVGAGGIGCEVLKNIVLLGFTNILCIDLDTIDVSNLNRQFLFRKRHVDKSKAMVAAQEVKQFLPNGPDTITIDARQANVKEEEYNVEFFSSFHAVLNCLDNISARKHVNRLCLAAKVPLVEAGTSGYLGQTWPISGGHTECYECMSRPTPKEYPVCTIRKTPDEPVHCVVWAKILYSQLFGPKDEENILSELEENGTMMKVKSIGRKDADADADATTTASSHSVDRAALRSAVLDLIRLLFVTEIEDLGQIWTHKTRKPPTGLPLDTEILSQLPSLESRKSEDMDRQRVWTNAECAHMLLASTVRIFAERGTEVGFLSFAKEDPDAVDFVTAAANLRMHNFGIDQASRWDIESIAGSIVPAIATTNAIIAGFQVVNLLKLLSLSSTKEERNVNVKKRCKTVYLFDEPRGRRVKRICLPSSMKEPNPDCFVCGTKIISLEVHELEKLPVHAFAKMMGKGFACNRPTLMRGSTCIYDSDYPEPGPDAEEEGLHPEWSMEKWGIKHGCVIQLADDQQDFSSDLIVYSAHLEEEEFPEGYRMVPPDGTLIGKKEKEDMNDEDKLIKSEKMIPRENKGDTGPIAA